MRLTRLRKHNKQRKLKTSVAHATLITWANFTAHLLPTLFDLHSYTGCRLPLLCSLVSREHSGPGTALLTGAILLLPSHCPAGSFFSVAFFDP